MPAKFEQQIADLCQLFKHMVLIDGTSRAFDRLLAARQHDRRLLIIFPQAPCNNARQRFMAFRQKDHQHLVLLVPALYLQLRRLSPLLGHILAGII